MTQLGPVQRIPPDGGQFPEEWNGPFEVAPLHQHLGLHVQRHGPDRRFDIVHVQDTVGPSIGSGDLPGFPGDLGPGRVQRRISAYRGPGGLKQPVRPGQELAVLPGSLEVQPVVGQAQHPVLLGP